jgi:hypothetical protein
MYIQEEIQLEQVDYTLRVVYSNLIFPHLSYQQICIKRNVMRRVPLLEHELLTQPEENHIY